LRKRFQFKKKTLEFKIWSLQGKLLLLFPQAKSLILKMQNKTLCNCMIIPGDSFIPIISLQVHFVCIKFEVKVSGCSQKAHKPT